MTDEELIDGAKKVLEEVWSEAVDRMRPSKPGTLGPECRLEDKAREIIPIILAEGERRERERAKEQAKKWIDGDITIDSIVTDRAFKDFLAGIIPHILAEGGRRERERIIIAVEEDWEIVREEGRPPYFRFDYGKWQALKEVPK